jgi:hypothetical protein
MSAQLKRSVRRLLEFAQSLGDEISLMRQLIVMPAMITVLAISVMCQTIQRGPSSWDGYVKRGRVDVRAGGSAWSVNGVSVSHTQEIYDSSDAARYVLSRLKGRMRPAFEISPSAGSLTFKVTRRKDSTRIAWVCGKDLHYIEAQSYTTVVALLVSWGPLNCS